jgi:REP element-mobilizing transposase RayT
MIFKTLCRMQSPKPTKQYRLPNRYYTEADAYFITICTRNREDFFGQIISKAQPQISILEWVLDPTPVGRVVQEKICRLTDAFPNAELDSAVVMPNHVHLILWLYSSSLAEPSAGLDRDARVRQGLQPLTRGSISSIINHFKGAVTKAAHQAEHVDFAWQHRFHDHVIREEQSLVTIRNYIAQNPERWAQDCFHPSNPTPWPNAPRRVPTSTL